MKVITIASQKGGSGKTTLTRNLAVAAQGPRTATVVIDLDPQGSLTAWWNERESAAPALASVKAAQLRDLSQSDEAAFCFVDTPPSQHREMRVAIEAADLVLIPVRPSPDDLRAVQATIDLVEAAGVPFAFVILQAKTRTRIAGEALRLLAQHGRVAPQMITDRIEYAETAIDGLGVTERPGKAADEINTLWKYVHSLMKKGK